MATPEDDAGHMAIERSILALGEMMSWKKRLDVLLPDPRIPAHLCSIFFLTGGPCSGKTSIANRLEHERRGLVCLVPEDVVRNVLEQASDDVRAFIQTRIAQDPHGALPDKLLFRILKIEIARHMFSEAGSDRFLIEGLPTSMKQFNKFKTAFGVVHVLILNLHPDYMERRAMVGPMTFAEGEARLAEFRARRDAWQARLYEFMVSPEFQEHCTYIDARASQADVTWYCRDAIDVIVNKGPVKTPRGITKLAKAVIRPFHHKTSQ